MSGDIVMVVLIVVIVGIVAFFMMSGGGAFSIIPDGISKITNPIGDVLSSTSTALTGIINPIGKTVGGTLDNVSKVTLGTQKIITAPFNLLKLV